MADLKSTSTEELKKELERREKPQSERPKLVAKPDFSALIMTVERGVSQIEKEGYQDDDFQHYVYEEAMTALYGKSYWLWLNERIRRG